MADGRITKRIVDSLKAAESDYVRWDGELKGFGVRVRPSGAKSFVAVYRTGGRNTPLRKITIGTFGKLTVEQARVAAARILAKAELGEDEAAVKTEFRTAKTVAALCEIYLAEGCDKKKPSTIAVDRGRIAVTLSHCWAANSSTRFRALRSSNSCRMLRRARRPRT